MSGKIIEVSCAAGHLDTIRSISDEAEISVISVSMLDEEKTRVSVRLFCDDQKVQATLDRMQMMLPAEAKALILLLPVDAQIGGESTLVKADIDQVAATREELFAEISRGAEYDFNFMLLAFLSTLVCAIGLIENDVAVVIGAMVIAPLLGPNLGLALGAALGDKELMKNAIITNLVGVTLTIGIGILLVLLWNPDLTSDEILARTTVKPGNVILALAAGIAAVQSLTTKLASLLVGVMVAVALVPPATVFGMMLGVQNWELATGSALLLAVNIAAVNLAAQVVFLFRGIRPRTWLEQRAAKEATWINLMVWGVLLGMCVFVLVFHIK